MLIKPVFSVTEEEEEGQTPEAEGELSPPEGTPARRSGQGASRSGGSTCGTGKQQPRSPRARTESGSRQVGSARQIVTASAADVLAHSGKSQGGEGGASSGPKLLRRLRCGAHTCPGTGLYPVLHALCDSAASPDRPSTLTPCVRDGVRHPPAIDLINEPHNPTAWFVAYDLLTLVRVVRPID
eukprot:COSAG01_NODE_429_length_17183_cov_22.990869_25_plen_183_part_00